MVGLETGPMASAATGALDEARASLIAAPDSLDGLHAAIWMGGARSHIGEPLSATALARSLVIDCAGDLPASYRASAAQCQPCVFVDHDGPNVAIERVRAVAAQAAVLAGTNGPKHIDAIYTMCTHGMNRSGLVAGLILRELGMSGEHVIDLISAARPGALSNQWFRGLLSS